ncbi:polysaccharide deacetylase family protein [Roseiarcaceae bacterium H3SJ34-1]|uniref:polysaccharide deacetylase family protein n=1 Tax=Terripilifer ovatus TaxID=3032367 RepID=UPI003AB9A574|nr:polysaccharide deacetylase family protein [Roseiarcaceae bacterium H3SJ34-1]
MTSAQSSPFPYLPVTERPVFKWPNGSRIAVWVVPNIEHFHIEMGPGAPDIRNYARRDYGNRVGIWRLMEVLTKHKIRGTVALNGEVVTHYPQIMKECARLNWELMGHGETNSTLLAGMDKEREKAVIASTKAAIASCGQSMRGWLGPGLTETWNTIDLLKDAGVEYVADWCNDDMPYRMNNGLHSIPYSLELNDMPLFAMPSISIADFKQRIVDSFDVLHAEGAKSAKVMCVALHPFLIGAPHRIKYLDEALQHITGHDGVWLATGSEIISAYREANLP